MEEFEGQRESSKGWSTCCICVNLRLVDSEHCWVWPSHQNPIHTKTTTISDFGEVERREKTVSFLNVCDLCVCMSEGVCHVHECIVLVMLWWWWLGFNCIVLQFLTCKQDNYSFYLLGLLWYWKDLIFRLILVVPGTANCTINDHWSCLGGWLQVGILE